MSATDLWGQPVTASPGAADHWNEFLRRSGARRAGDDTSLAAALAADPRFAAGHAAAAVLGLLLGVDGFDPVHHARLAGEAVLDGPVQDWERSLVAAVGTTVADGLWPSAQAWLDHQERFPGDPVALLVASFLLTFSTRSDRNAEQERRARRRQHVIGEDPGLLAYLAMLAQERGELEAAHRLGARGLELDPGSLAAAHPVAHVHYESGDHAAGAAWLDGWLGGADDAAGFRGHLVWHSGLHHLALGHGEVVLDRYAACGGALAGGRMVDGPSLLWRLQLHGLVDSGTDPATPSVAALVGRMSQGFPTTFLGAHVALALATAGDAEGLRHLAHRAAVLDVPGAAELLPPLALGLAAYVEGEPGLAADRLLSVEPQVGRLGGSHAQREVFEDTLIQALVRAERFDEARLRLQRRLDRRESPWDRGLLSRAQ